MTSARAFHVPAGYDVYQCGHRLGLAPAGHFAGHGWHEEHAIGSTSEWSVPGVRIGTGIRGFAKVAAGPVTIRKLGAPRESSFGGNREDFDAIASFMQANRRKLNQSGGGGAKNAKAGALLDEWDKFAASTLASWYVSDSDLAGAASRRDALNNLTFAPVKDANTGKMITAKTVKGWAADKDSNVERAKAEASTLGGVSYWTWAAIGVGAIGMAGGGAAAYFLMKPILGAKIAGGAIVGALGIYGTGKIVNSDAVAGVKALGKAA